MLKIRNAFLLGAVLMLFAGAAMAAGTLQQSGMEADRHVTITHPLGGSQSITQNTDPATIAAGGGIACNGTFGTTDTGNWRIYDLNGDHALSGEVCVKNVAYGMESVSSDQTITISVGCHSGQPDHPYVSAFIDLAYVTEVGTANELIPSGSNLVPFDTDAGGCCNADSEDLVIAIISPDCDAAGDPNCPANSGQMFMGGNSAGQLHATYISAADCGITNPFDLALLGFPDAHHLQVITVNAGGGGVPAATGIGMLLMVLILVGTSAYFMRRQVTA
jgi:hypothetical protein